MPLDLAHIILVTGYRQYNIGLVCRWLQTKYPSAFIPNLGTTRSVRRWLEEAHETLQGWQAPCDLHGEDTDVLIECITDYLSLYVDSTAPAETVHYYPNTKLWLTKDIKAMLSQCKKRKEVRTIQGELKVTIREGLREVEEEAGVEASEKNSGQYGV